MPTNAQMHTIEAYVIRDVLAPLLDTPADLHGFRWNGSTLRIFLLKPAFDRLRSAFVKRGVLDVGHFFARKTVPNDPNLRILIEFVRQRDLINPAFAAALSQLNGTA